MEFNEYIAAIRLRWKLLVVMTLLGALAGFGTTLLLPKQYEAGVQLFVSASGSQDDANQRLQGSNFTQQRVKSYAQAITSPLVLAPVIERLGIGGSPEDLAMRVVSDVPLDTVLIDVTVTDEDPVLAAELANAITAEFSAVVPELENATAGTSPVKVSPLSTASPPRSPVSPKVPVNVAAGALMGLALALGIVLLRKLMDTVVRTESDVTATSDAPVLGEIPFAKETAADPLVVLTHPQAPVAESFRTLRTNLQFVDAAHSTRSLVVTSSVPEEGKTTTTANLALALGEDGARVCLVEADLRRPRLVRYLGLVEEAGLTNLIVGDVEVEDVIQPMAGTNVTVLGAGPVPPNPSELLGSPAMGRIVEDLESRFDYVIFDAPPLLPVTDAAVLSRHVDGVVVVVGADVVRREQLRKTLSLLENVDSRVLGLVVNRLSGKGAGTYTYYREGYESDPIHDPGAPRTSARRRAQQRARR